MASGFNATRSCWRSLVSKNGGVKMNYYHRAFVTSTTPKTATAATAATHIHATESLAKSLKFKADHFPIYIMGGFILGAGVLALTNSTLHLVHNPGVQVTKTNRSMFPEISNPDAALASGDNFINKSVLRKVAHIKRHSDVVPMDRTPDIYSRSRDIETLKTVGVEPGVTRG